ncbi:unnamed protein product [Oncorhynchus mykiss]|uniref:PH domain-containing protein n=1 Tax=Oncorhynchus mykiss TaxID=8022 RepID=A0A060YIB5_ONCMY|nr:unnamed protein product [Oncorhynchus mykiss]
MVTMRMQTTTLLLPASTDDNAKTPCTVVYAPKDGRRKRHELRFTPPSGEALVLAVQSREQAHRWLRVVHKVSQGKGPEEPTSPMMPRKTELDKVCVCCTLESVCITLESVCVVH